MQLHQRLSQYLVNFGLTSPGIPHQHHSMSHHNSLHQLQNFNDEPLRSHQMILLQIVMDSPFQIRVLVNGNFHPGEKVGNNAVK